MQRRPRLLVPLPEWGNKSDLPIMGSLKPRGSNLSRKSYDHDRQITAKVKTISQGCDVLNRSIRLRHIGLFVSS